MSEELKHEALNKEAAEAVENDEQELIMERNQMVASVDKLPERVVRDLAVLAVGLVYAQLINEQSPLHHVLALRIMQLAGGEYGFGMMLRTDGGSEPAMMDTSAVGLLADLRNKAKATTGK